MGAEFSLRSVDRATGYPGPGQRASYSIQTNGTLIDEEWAAFLAAHDVLVGISINGPREPHDTSRVNKGGRGSFAQLMRGLRHLADAGGLWNALTTVHAANQDRGQEVYRFLRDDRGARFVQFIPIVERVTDAGADGEVPWTPWRGRPLYVQEGERTTRRPVGAAQYGRALPG